ncbi:hypothetical protein ACFO4P_16935 [Epilithonimonas pallida]|uniref:Uncharacterized protein n=1 Tax=Epilithonimonas pallida TaxID=373671 RepID=A0ABY1R4P1_9FLAO|nr:hypothetical protein [Epilithonimonas pallida]SMP94669.1 hypothetical protein SAMN05421679_10672 [Epilithonimonas pallida]
MATIRTYHQTLFNIPAVQKEVKLKPKKPPVPEKVRKKNKRMYNASYRLRNKIGESAFPKKSKNIFCELGDPDIENIKEIKILTKEYGFAVKPLPFLNL